MGDYNIGTGSNHQFDPAQMAQQAHAAHVGNPGGGHPTTPADDAKRYPTTYSDDGMGTNKQTIEPASGFSNGRGSAAKPIDAGNSTVTANVGIDQKMSLQKGYQPSQREITNAGVQNPGATGEKFYQRDSRTRGIAQGSAPDTYVGKVNDNQTGVSADVQYNANTGNAMGNTVANLAAAGQERQNRIAAAAGTLSPADQQKISPKTPVMAPQNTKKRK